LWRGSCVVKSLWVLSDVDCEKHFWVKGLWALDPRRLYTKVYDVLLKHSDNTIDLHLPLCAKSNEWQLVQKQCALHCTICGGLAWKDYWHTWVREGDGSSQILVQGSIHIIQCIY
jgi:hypothetical protein